MGNSISNTYNIVGVDSGDGGAIVMNSLLNVQGVISVNIDLEKKEVQVVSNEQIATGTLEDALVDTNYYITEITPNDLVAVPTYSSVINSVKLKHSASRDLDGGGDGSVNTGPVTDYEND